MAARLHHCWNCEYDVSDQLARGVYVCPECGSPINNLRRRMAVYHGRRHLRVAKVAGVVGVLLVATAHAMTRQFTTPQSRLGGWLLLAAAAAFVLAIHKVDRITWRFSGSGPIVWLMRLIGPLVVGICLTFALFMGFLIVRFAVGDLR